jgi:hypothetical protein
VKIKDIPFTEIAWDRLPAAEHKGESGTSHWRTVEAGELRIRQVEYSPGFKADHWCGRGHVVLVLDGEIEIVIRGGDARRLGAGAGFAAGDDEAHPHLVLSGRGARVFIVD